MTQTFTLELSPNTVVGPDFIVELPASRTVSTGRFVMKQTFVDSGSIRTIAGQMIDDRLERPVLGSDF